MDAWALTFGPHQLGDKAAITVSQRRLLDLGLTVIGEYEGSKKIEVYSEIKKKGHTIADLGRFAIHDLIQLVGEEAVLELVHEGKEVPDGMCRMSDVRNAIANEASDQTFNPDHLHGGGAWLVEDQIVLVKQGEVGVLKGDKIERCESPLFAERVFDISSAADKWVDFDVLNRYLLDAQRDEWCRETFAEADAMFAKWFWKQPPAPQVVASLVICTWLQTTWKWRARFF